MVNKKFVLLVLFLLILSLRLAYSQDIGEKKESERTEVLVNEHRIIKIYLNSPYSNIYESQDSMNKFSLAGLDIYSDKNEEKLNKLYSYIFIETSKAEEYRPIRLLYVMDDLNKELVNNFIKDKYKEFKLDKKGVVPLNFILFYSIKQKDLRIVYASSCIYDKEKNEELLKKYEDKIKNTTDEKLIKQYLTELVFDLYEISFNILQSNDFALKGLKSDILEYCPESSRSKYKIEEEIDSEVCKPLFEGDTFNSERIKILILGKNFSNEREFKESIQKNVLDEGLMNVEPFKSYTKNGKDGLFYFVIGDYNLKAKILDGNQIGNIPNYKNLEVESEINEIKTQCPNTYYNFILINENYVDEFRSYNSPTYKNLYTIENPIVIVHEFGHSFLLQDEYGEFGFGNFGSTDANCADDIEQFNPVLNWQNDYGFKVCGRENSKFRTSYESIMRNSHVYSKFNYISCLFLVREFENKDKIDNEKVINTCKKLYDEGKIQLNNEVNDNDPFYKLCLSKTSNNILECKKIIISCAKKEDYTNRATQLKIYFNDEENPSTCFNTEVNKIKGGNNE